MSDLDRIRKRIRHKEENPKQNRIFSMFYHFILMFMTVLSLTIGGLIVTKTPMAEVKNKGIILFESLRNTDFILFENWFSPTTDMVQANRIYQKIDDHYYTNESNVVYCISDGIVVYINENQTNSIMVKNDNGIVVTYGNLTEVQVKVEDRVLKDTILGTYYEKVSLDFLENQQMISYEEALSRN